MWSWLPAEQSGCQYNLVASTNSSLNPYPANVENMVTRQSGCQYKLVPYPANVENMVTRQSGCQYKLVGSTNSSLNPSPANVENMVTGQSCCQDKGCPTNWLPVQTRPLTLIPLTWRIWWQDRVVASTNSSLNPYPANVENMVTGQSGCQDKEVARTNWSPVQTRPLTLMPLTWRIWWAPNNASRWQMGFNSAFKGLIIIKLITKYS